jgi:beta-phosphoglucomutase-like phosphatase (HAD superfamily)
MNTLIYDAVLFDLDGVLTSTAALHAQCWKLTFEELGESFSERDYLDHVDVEVLPGASTMISELPLAA